MEQRIDITPDLYSRNFIIQTIINQYRSQTGKDKLKILNVGGRNGKMDEFLPNDEITLIDIREGNEPNLIVGDATDMKELFKDGVFDVVTSGDVYEHIPTNKKEAFFNECTRVSKGLTIIAAPFDDENTQNAEELAREYFKKYTGKDHEWLSEHDEIKLPSLEVLIKFSNEQNLVNQIFYSNNIDNWLAFQLASFASYWQSADEEQTKNIYSKYNKSILKIEDPNTDFYRKILVFSKEKLNIDFEYQFDPQEKVNFMNACIDHISSISKYSLNQKDAHIDNLERDKELLLNTIIDQELLLNTIIELKSTVTALKRTIEEHQNTLKSEKIFSESLEKQIRDKDVHINNLAAEIRNIKTSNTWKLFLLYKTTTHTLKHPIRVLKRFHKSIKNIGIKGTITNIIRKINPQYKIQTNPLHISEVDQYKIWLQQNEVTSKMLKGMSKELLDLNYKPKISIIMPVYNVEEKWLRKAIESVQAQIYENWELCINDDASTAKHIKPLLKEYEKKDKRIKVKYSTKNQHISGSSNEALKLASGEFIVLMDNDDEIAPNALFEVVKILNENKEFDFIYTDEDKLNKEGYRVEPFFKPDWSPDYFLSTMYTCHLGVYRKKIIDKIKGFRKGYEGAQDYDLVLRFTEQTNKIHHIPQILYHWRKIPGSTSAEYSEKCYAKDAARKALEDAVKRRTLKAEVLNGRLPESFRVKYEIKDNPLVTIIIPTWNKKDFLKTCIDSIEKKTTYSNYELLIVDNRSDEPDALEYLKELSKKHQVTKYNKPFNFSAINNFAVKKAKGEFILFLNNDIEVINEGWLSAMVEHIQREEVGAVGAKLLYPNGQIQHAGVILGVGNHGIDGIAGHALKYTKGDQNDYTDLGVYKNRVNMICNYSGVTAACLMTKKKIFKEVKGFNEKDLTVAFNDIDLCLKIREKGYRIVYTPYAELYHYESISRGAEDDPKKQARFTKECNYMLDNWGTILRNDPFYNSNLTKVHEDYSLNI